MFERRARGEAIAALCRFLEERGVITPYGNAGWVPNSLRKVIANRAYLGEAHHGAFVNASAHPALIDEDTWLRAQHACEAPSSRGKRPTLLGGLLRCAGCRIVMNSIAGRHGTCNAVYSCHRRFSGGTCTQPTSITSAVIEPYVERLLFGELRRRKPAEDRVGPAEADFRKAQVQLVAYR